MSAEEFADDSAEIDEMYLTEVVADRTTSSRGLDLEPPLTTWPSTRPGRSCHGLSRDNPLELRTGGSARPPATRRGPPTARSGNSEQLETEEPEAEL